MKHVFIALAICAVSSANAQVLSRSVSFDPISVTTVAGSGVTGFADGSANTARFGLMKGITTFNGNIYVADAGNHRIRMISANGTVTTFAGTGVAGHVDGPGATAQFNNPYSISSDKTGNLYVNDFANNAVRKITPNGTVTTIVKAGTGVAAAYNYFGAFLAADDMGNVYISRSNTIFKVTPAGVLSVFASNVGENMGAFELQGFALDAQGNLCVLQYFGRTLKISPAGVVTTVPTNITLTSGLAGDKKGNVYVSGMGTTIVKSSPGGFAAVVAGSNTAGYKDTTGIYAQFGSSSYMSLTADETGNIYVCDNGNSRIRKLSVPVLRLLTTPGAASAAAYFSISGILMTGAATLQAPAAFEFSLNQGGPYSNSLNIAPVSGEINTVPVFIRLAASAAAGTYIDSISLSTAGATTQKLAVTGVVANGNPPPVSIAGSNVTVALPVSAVTLDGSASYDPDGSIVQYYWYQVQGPVQAVIGNNFSPVTTATGFTTAGTYVFGLQVKDNLGVLKYSSKTVTVTAATTAVPACVTNISPANGSTIATQTTAMLSWQASPGASSYEVYFGEGSNTPGQVSGTTGLSYSPQGLTAGRTYRWYVVPINANGSNTACATSSTATFTTAPLGNVPAVPNAGGNITITLPNSSVTLDASASTGSIVQYYWYQAQGPVQSVIGNSLMPVTTATGLTIAGTYVFGLQVKDNNGTLKYAFKTVIVNPASTAPACVTNTSPANGSTIAAQTTATLTWPAAATATSYDVYLAAGTGTPTVLVTNTAALTYTASGLAANTTYSWYIAPRNASGPATTCSINNKTTFTTAAAGNQPTASNAGSNVTITLPTNSVALDGSASTGNIVQYYWYQSQGPVQAVIGNNFSSVTTATGLTSAGTYVFGLQVKDNLGVLKYSYKTVIVHAAGTRIIDPATFKIASLKADESSALPSVTAVINPNPVVTGQQAKLQINSNKAGTVMVNIVGSNGAVIDSKRVNLVAGVNITTVSTAGLAQGFHIISIGGAAKPFNLKLVVQ